MAGDLDLRSLGCGDNSCMFGRPGGMATNGGCRCFCRHRSDPREDRRKAEALLAEVRRLRADREKAREALTRLLVARDVAVEAKPSMWIGQAHGVHEAIASLRALLGGP